MSIAFGNRHPCDVVANVDQQRQVECPRQHKPWVLGVAVLGSSLAFIEGSVVAVALPYMQADFAIDSAAIQWVNNAYLLVLGAFLLIGGAAGDVYGLKRVFLAGTALFGLGALACGLAETIHGLIGARVLQALGAAALVPTSLALVSRYFDKGERARAIGIWAGSSALTTALGPALGGWLVEVFGWPAVFLVVPPLAALAIMLALWRVPVDTARKRAPLDYVGAVLLAGALLALVVAILDIEIVQQWTLVALTLVLATGFILRQHYSRVPMLPLALFRIPAFSGVNVMTMLLYGALSGILYFLPFNLVQVQGYSALQTGAAFLPMTLMIGFGSILAGDVIDRFPQRIVLTMGPLVAALGFAACALPGTETQYVSDWLPGIFLIGMGMTLCVAPLTTAVMNAVDDSDAGLASGVNNTAARLAGALSVALLTAVAVDAFASSLDEKMGRAGIPAAQRQQLLDDARSLAALEAPVELAASSGLASAIENSYVDAFRRIALACSLAAVLSALVAWITLRPASPGVVPRAADP